MDTEELLKRVKRIELKTRALTNNVFAGEYRSAFKGRGMSFAEVREYQPGDDVRDIDWNVTARTNRPHIKIYEEERELTVMLLIDVSGSLVFGSGESSQRDVVTEIAATLAFSAAQNNDKVGVIFFSNQVEHFIPPKKGRKHVLYIIRELLNFIPKSRRTDISVGLEHLMRAISRRSIAFLLSDFLDSKDYSQQLRMVAHRHDLVAVRVYDNRLAQLPNVGLLQVADAETGHVELLDSSSEKVRQWYEAHWGKLQKRLEETFKKSGIDLASLATNEDYIEALKRLLHNR